MTADAIEVRALGAAEAVEAVPALARVLVDCVENGASVSFMAPFTQAEGEAFFARVAEDVAAGQAILVVAFRDGEIVGTVQAQFARQPNQPHRFDIAKMLVHSKARNRGVGAALLAVAERAAAATGRTVGVLDTVTGSVADRLYARAGWVRVGEIPDYALWPRGGLCATTFFYKRVGSAA
ncbi:MAG: GNAT family N-acetyltransferase [Methylobacteriaceae bacterium]|nr:GNAT family N-acetyltransferase [Methylobacteriaceae bacterium]